VHKTTRQDLKIIAFERNSMPFASALKKFTTAFQRIPRRVYLYYAVLGLWLATTAMHIPDGYLSPVTSAVMFAIMIPFWYFGLKKLRGKINARSAPLVALLAAFSFIIMMFNVPLPGGTTGHAVGGALIAIILGPEVATIAVSIALLIQAIFFGDGGILAFGANCFNMAVVLPYVSYAIFQTIAGKQPIESARRAVGAFAGGYIGLTVASFFAGMEFGIQPALFHTADGTPLYAPYPLSVALPAMVIPHMLVASVVEGLVTALVILYLQKTNKEILSISTNPAAAEAGGFRRLRGFWVTLAILVFLTPIGLLAPGTAWGEWGSNQLTQMGLSFIPQGFARLQGLWGAPLADYDLPALGNANLGYIISAILGILIIGILAWLLTTAISSGRSSNTGGQPPKR
jgi:cobalt/nickel transport system permease protein